jgi:hypothetical protein
MGIVLLLSGLITLPVMAYATTAAIFGWDDVAARISRIVTASVPASLLVGWVMLRLCDLIMLAGFA